VPVIATAWESVSAHESAAAAAHATAALAAALGALPLGAHDAGSSAVHAALAAALAAFDARTAGDAVPKLRAALQVCAALRPHLFFFDAARN
jgi:hypothetical protein